VAAHRYFGEPVKAAAVPYVKHLDRMRAFYQQRFGLEAASTAEDHCVLESGAWTLSLVVVRDNIAATIHVLEPPRRRDDAAVNPRSVFQTSTISGRSWQGWVARSFRGTPSGISRALDTATVSTRRATSYSCERLETRHARTSREPATYARFGTALRANPPNCQRVATILRKGRIPLI
jgi:hypothetical protein